MADAPIPMSRSLLKLALSMIPFQVQETVHSRFQSSSNVFVLHFYSHWLLEHNLLGESGSSKDIFTLQLMSQNQARLQDVVQASYNHRFFCVRDGGKKFDLNGLFQRWNFPTNFEII